MMTNLPGIPFRGILQLCYLRMMARYWWLLLRRTHPTTCFRPGFQDCPEFLHLLVLRRSLIAVGRS